VNMPSSTSLKILVQTTDNSRVAQYGIQIITTFTINPL
jgi:hypothetical protein